MALALLAGGARAQVAVVGTHRCDEETARAVSALRAALVKGGAHRALEEAELLRELAAPGGPPRQGAELLEAARKDFFDDVAGERLSRSLLAAHAELLRLPPSEQAWRARREVILLLAWSAVREGRLPDAERWLAELAPVDPSLSSLDPAHYPPSLRELAGQARRKAEAEAVHPLSISTRPVGLPLFVRGAPLGRSPLVLRVPGGDHSVDAAFPDGAHLPRRVRVDGPTSVELSASFDGAPRASGSPCLATDADAQAWASFGRQLKVERLVLAQVQGEGLLARVVEVPSGVVTRAARLPAASVQQVDALVAYLTGGPAAPPLQPLPVDPLEAADGWVPGAPSGAAKLSVHKRPWVVTAAAVGVASLGAALVFHARANATQRRLSALVQPGGAYALEDKPRVDAFLEKLQRERALTAGFAGGAALGIGISAVLLVW